VFLFNLFEKKKQDTAASRFVGGTSQDARVKNALDNAYRAVPAAKSPEEAALGYIDIQNSLNQKQDQALDQQTKTNQQQTQQINDLVNDMRRKEKDFRDLNAQIADMPNVTPQQVAKMAQDIEAAHDSEKGQPVDVSNVVNKRVAAQASEPQQRTVYAPGPGASISQQANYQKAKDQGAATAKTQPAATQATTQPTTSRALGQMASQLTQPQSRVYKAKQPAQQELPVNNVTQMPSTPAAQQRLQQLAGAGFPTMDAANQPTRKQFAESTSPADLQAIAQHNNQAFSQAWAHSQSTKLYFGDGQWEDLTFPEVEQIVSAIATDYTEQTRPQVWQQLFTDHSYFKAFKAQHLSQMPLQFSEGDVISMTGSPSVPGNVKAYQYALEILKAAFDERVPTAKIDQMKQTLFHDFQARIQQAPDGTYYLNINGAKSRLPDPRTFPMEEDAWHAGDNSWSSEHDQWARESTNPASPKDTIQRYLAIDKQTDVEAVKAAIHAISSDTALKPESKSRYLGYIGMIINRHRLPIGRDYYQFMQKFMESQDMVEGIDDLKKKMSKFEALALAANRAGDDDKCKMYQQKVQSLKQKLSQIMTEELGDSPVAGAITRRILMQRLDLLKQYGPELVGAAVDNVADYVGDVDEIGSSDVSAWVAQVERMLKENPPEAFAEGWSDAMVARRTGRPRTPYSVYINGRKWKDFENDDHARAVMDKLKAKFKADGRDPETITIAPTDMSEGVEDYSGTYSPEAIALGKRFCDHYNITDDGDIQLAVEIIDIYLDEFKSTGVPVDLKKIKSGVADAFRQVYRGMGPGPTFRKKFQEQGVAEGLLYSGDTWQDVLYRINVLNDIFGDQKDLAATFEPASQPEWGPFRDRILRSRTVLDTYAKVKQLANMNVPLTDVEIEMLADVAWDGGGGPVEPAGHWGDRDYDWLEDLYAQQFAVVQHLLDQKAQGHGQNKTKSGQTVHEQGVAEAQTDYQKRRQRERDVDAGKPVSRQPKNPQTDYAKKRAKEKRDQELGEGTINYWTKLQNERNTKIASLVNELKESIEK
jgi:hypothetical protein